MSDQEHRFWPFRPQTSIAWSIAILAGLLFILLLLKNTGLWQMSEASDTAVLIGVLLVSLLPIVLALLDVLKERGGAVEYGGLRIDFFQVPQMGTSGFTVPTNIGVPGQPVSDSSTTEILDALREAVACEIIVIDLEEGQAWWETRLLVLLAGAARLGRPEKVVFVGKDGGIDQCLQGWGYSAKLLPYLLKAHPQYLRSYHTARAAGRQWELVEPVNPAVPHNPAAVPPQPSWMQVGLATMHPWMAFDSVTGLPNELLTEQLLATDLGEKVEFDEGPRAISLVRLREIFQPVLYRTAIDTSWATERQIAEFFESDSDYLAITQKGSYVSLISRPSVLNAFVRSVVERE